VGWLIKLYEDALHAKIYEDGTTIKIYDGYVLSSSSSSSSSYDVIVQSSSSSTQSSESSSLSSESTQSSESSSSSSESSSSESSSLSSESTQSSESSSSESSSSSTQEELECKLQFCSDLKTILNANGITCYIGTAHQTTTYPFALIDINNLKTIRKFGADIYIYQFNVYIYDNIRDTNDILDLAEALERALEPIDCVHKISEIGPTMISTSNAMYWRTIITWEVMC